MSSSLPPLVQACSGALASASANTISYPLDLVTTKLQTTRSRKARGLRGALAIFHHILRAEGLSGLYDGILTDTASTLLSNFLYFYFYTLLHALVARQRAQDSAPTLSIIRRAVMSPTAPVLLPVPAELAVGFIAGVASRAVSTPLSVITVHLQSDDDDDSQDGESSKSNHAQAPAGLAGVVRSIYATRGLGGFWAGFAPTLPLAFTPALTFLLIQLFRRVRLPHTVRSARAFADGACANALALAALYPLVLAKVRVQAGARDMSTVWRGARAQRGWAGLYDGLGIQILKGFVSQGVTMLVKQRIELAIVSLHMRGR
ncbi:mitochondrial carrier [Amylocystis lapponica]|nr:mitochondrial carrier [Amylocystis lapponica]